jgi:nucleotide-binding universal stress UspA family protein
MSRIVVGVDGSPGALAALRFALEEARLRSATLDVVHAWLLPLVEAVPGPFLLELPGPGAPPLEETRRVLQERAERLLDDALREAGGEGDGLEIRLEAVETSPVRALLERAEGAELLVVGSRGRGGFAGLLLGSVGQQCAHHATCPIVIVPTPGPGRR